MPYRVAIRREAQKRLVRVVSQDRDSVGAAAFCLTQDPRPRNARSRRRGDPTGLVTVLEVGHRQGIYA